MASLVSGVTTACPNLDADSVKEIIDSDKTDAQINNFINMAYYATIPIADKLDDCGGSDALCQIMQVLAAHFLTMWERQAKSESVAGEWSITYLGRDGLGLDASLYGQQARVLDCSGTLAKLGLKGVLMQVANYKQLEDVTLTEEDY